MSLGLPNHGWSDSCIDIYEKIECIGAGTYGQVFLASHRDTGERVALKKIRSMNEVQGLPVTTIREIKVLKAINHRNVVGLREVIVTNEMEMGDVDDDVDADGVGGGDKAAGPVPMDFSCGCIYLVLEYVEHDLTGLLDRQYP
jgi:serine/threonine protein kinase